MLPSSGRNIGGTERIFQSYSAATERQRKFPSFSTGDRSPYYDVGAKQWRVEPGDFKVFVGRSSAQIELQGKLTLPAASGP